MTAEVFKNRFLPMHGKLYGVAFALTGNAADAEDLLQDAYIRLWNRRMELGAVNNAEAYAVRLVRNLCIDFLRAARQPSIREHFLADVEESPETKSIQREEIGLVKSLIDRLPDNQRQVIRLHGVENLSTEEIERITGFSAVNVRVLLSRARKFVREQYIKMTENEQF